MSFSFLNKKVVSVLLCFVPFFLLLLLFSPKGAAVDKDRYDTIGGKIVTRDTVDQLVPKAPKDIEYKVKKWFYICPGAYDILVKQGGVLTDVGNLILKCDQFFAKYRLKNLGNFNYVFKFSGESFFVKIFGPNNRFIYSANDYGLYAANIYTRLIRKKKDGRYINAYDYMDLEEDKKRIKEYFYCCFPDQLLESRPTKKQRLKLLSMVAGAFPQSTVRGVVFEFLHQRYRKNIRKVKEKTIRELFEEFLDYAFYVVGFRCYRRDELEGKKFVETHNIANRVFCRARFEEAIDKFNLHRLEKPPKSYMIHLNQKDSAVFSDRNVVLVQYALEEHEPFETYLKNRKLLNKVFTREVMLQLLTAMKYAGLWDITGKNIHVNKKNNKITYIDFEPKNDVMLDELFNKSETKLRINLCYLMTEFTKRFPLGTEQRTAVEQFMKDNKEIDLEWYFEETARRTRLLKEKNGRKNKFLSTGANCLRGPSLLGKLVYYDNPLDEECDKLRQGIFEALAYC